ncbi:hypothetical protein B0T22DRAFT_509731 [Podospora appendiculata]|uniref:Uncharacterized protein n=1 Tax=Podospora appendiculata TaxID=314037 RepID=A0AAE0X7B6_9PEZI|nr:hypothetical protein B0T22DRAFT_509731 [Podospora appendiculata]
MGARSKRPTGARDKGHENELQNDDDTTWFGVERDASHQLIFQDYGRFAALMSESQTQELGARYPQLVSFIGQTETGTSTPIKMFIDRLDSASPDHGPRYPTPATSSNNDRLPTTADVHLYTDPLTFTPSRIMSSCLFSGIKGHSGPLFYVP